MSQGKNFSRRDRRDFNNNDGVHADPRAIQSRQHENQNRAPAEIKWITKGPEVVEACKKMLHGIPGRYPVFGIKLKVELRNGPKGKYPVVAYYGAKPGEEGQKLSGTNFPKEFAIAPVLLTWTISEKTEFKSVFHEILVRTLLDQPEMQQARELFAKEMEKVEHARKHAEREAASANRSSLLAELRGKATGRGKPTPPVLESLNDILSAEWGTFVHDGLTILVCRGIQGPSSNRTLVRLRNVPEGHPMAEAAAANIYAYQDALTYADDMETNEERTGRALLGYKMRMYFRSQLIEAGVVLSPPVSRDSTVATNGNGAHPQEGSDSGNVRRVEEGSLTS